MARRVVRSITIVGFLLAGPGVLPGCGDRKGGGGPSPGPEEMALQEYTVSYRTHVRVPPSGKTMTHDELVDQVTHLDPISAKRCPVSNDASFRTAADALGGFTWTHPVAIIKDRSRPLLYRGKVPPPLPPVPTEDAAGSAARAPTIERPDLVGYQENTAIFLSQRHGLLAVKTDGAAPILSCALKLPGQPKYFFYKGDEIVLLVNGAAARQAALLRFRATPAGFDFIDAVPLPDQQIQDARLFDRTLIVYSTLLAPAVPDPNAPTAVSSTATPATPTSSASAGATAPIIARPASPSLAGIGVKLTAVKWDTALAVAWHEDFLDDPAPTDVLGGQDPATVANTLTIGDVVATARTFKPFISASDRYVVVSRDVSRTVFTGPRTDTYSYCTAFHQGPPRSVTSCYPNYEQRPNPDYRDPRSTKGDYACNGKSLLDCIQEAAPTVSRYIYVRVGETCNTYTVRDFICDRSETKSVTYPTYRYDPSTQFVVYRYSDGDFVKLDEQLFQMADPGTGAVAVDALTFTGKPLEVAGNIDHKNDLQFQHGHFYVLTNQGQQLHTLLLVGNSIAQLGTLGTPRGRVGTGYSGAHTTLFSDDRMMVSRSFYDYYLRPGIYTWSDVVMLDLTAASFPRPVNQFVMPGSSDQLILAASGILGPGTVSFTSGNVARNLEKITLFNPGDASEVDNVLLGTEFNADLVSSWFAPADDQRIRLDDGNQRLFLPYSGYHHAPQDVFNPAAHRLNITGVGGGRLTSEVTFDLAEDIIRTVSLDSLPGAGRALAFGDSSVYVLNQTATSDPNADPWSLGIIEEFATPIGVYRTSDLDDLHARIDRVGIRCQISTFKGSAHAFDRERWSAGPQIPCTETGQPIGIGAAVVFADSSTGWSISPDGRTIEALTAGEVRKLVESIPAGRYCTLDPSVSDGTPVDYLDDVPASVTCLPWPTAGGSPSTGP